MSNTFTLANPKRVSIIRYRTAVFGYFFCQGLGFASWASRIPSIKEALGLSEGQLGAMLLMLPLGQLFTMPLSGKLVTKYGSAKVISVVSILYALILLSISFASNIYMLAASLFLFGIAGNMGSIAVNTQAVAVEKMFRKSIMTSFHGGWSLAGFFGALIGLLTINFHLNTTYLFLIILSLVLINTFWNIKYLVPKVEHASSNAEKIKFKPDAILIQLGIVGFFSMATEGAMFDWTGVYFKDVVKSPTSLVILGYTSFMIMMATGRFLGDFLITKLGKRKVLIISGLLMFVGMMTSVLFPYVSTSTIGFMLVGLGVACCVPTVYSMAGKHSSIPPGMAIALVSSISFLGFLMGPPLIGFIAEIFGLRWSFTLFSVFGLAMVVMMFTSSYFKKS
ncbi:MFS transporter [Soonwooa purpurea]